MLRLSLLLDAVPAREAVVVPSAKAMLFDTNPLRDDAVGIESEADDGGAAIMCNFAGA